MIVLGLQLLLVCLFDLVLLICFTLPLFDFMNGGVYLLFGCFSRCCMLLVGVLVLVLMIFALVFGLDCLLLALLTCLCWKWFAALLPLLVVGGCCRLTLSDYFLFGVYWF